MFVTQKGSFSIVGSTSCFALTSECNSLKVDFNSNNKTYEVFYIVLFVTQENGVHYISFRKTIKETGKGKKRLLNIVAAPKRLAKQKQKHKNFTS